MSGNFSKKKCMTIWKAILSEKNLNLCFVLFQFDCNILTETFDEFLDGVLKMTEIQTKMILIIIKRYLKVLRI